MTDFATFWAIARHWRGRCPNPRKTAEQAWHRAIKGGASPREMIAGAAGYKAFLDEADEDPRFACMASVFINQERWEQYLAEPDAKAYLARPELRVVK